ncbi:MAG: restriction endonuclease subunit S [Betaproteobacteria bacterium]|nr:restriction endonuclease subunit S [Betaproteobacteria bacterium]
MNQGDVLVSMTRPNLNAVAIVPPELDGAIGSTGFHVLRARESESSWLFYAVQTNDFVEAMCQLVQGALYPAVRPKDIRAYPIPLPLVDVQRQLVAEIEKQFTRLEAGIAALRRVQANLKRYRAAVLKAACEGRLVPTEAELARKEGRAYESADKLLARILTERREKWTGRGKYKEPTLPDTEKLAFPPEGWTWTRLDAAIVSGPQNGVYLHRDLYGRGHPILRIDDYQNGWVRPVEQLNSVDADRNTIATYQLQSGDLVVNRVNSMTHLGKCLVVRENLVPALFESNMMRARLATGIRPQYVELYLHSEEGRARLTSGAKWAVNQASINQQDVRRTALPLPPLAEQKRIVAEVERRLSVVEEQKAVVTSTFQRATRLRQSVLQRAFSQ